jgi:hypothetical protein
MLHQEEAAWQHRSGVDVVIGSDFVGDGAWHRYETLASRRLAHGSDGGASSKSGGP